MYKVIASNLNFFI